MLEIVEELGGCCSVLGRVRSRSGIYLLRVGTASGWALAPFICGGKVWGKLFIVRFGCLLILNDVISGDLDLMF